MEKKGKGLDLKVQRRIIELVNGAGRAQDIADRLQLDHDRACRVLEVRDSHGPFGLRDLKPLVDLLGDNILDLWLRHFGPAVYGQWSDPLYETPGNEARAAHAALVRTSDPEKGRVLFISGHDQHLGPGYVPTPFLWDPDAPDAESAFFYPDNEPTDNLYCAGHAFLSDGRLLAAGGGGAGPNNVNRAWKFDPLAGTNGVWSRTAGDMANAQWYPTVVNLGAGRFLVTGGRPNEPAVEVYDEWSDSFQPVSVTVPRDFAQNYPGLHLIPWAEGGVFYTSTGFGNAGSGTYTGTVPTGTFYLRFDGPGSAEWVDLPGTMGSGNRVKGMSAPLFIGPIAGSYIQKILVVGGNGQDTAEAYNLSTLTWEPATTIPGDAGATARNNANVVLLPDGTAFVCGGSGSGGDVRTSALYDPLTNAWSPMDALTYGRAYHSVALLLPSGQVMVTGGQADSAENRTIEVFSPPYLFRGARPQIASAPGVIHHGREFQIESPDAGDIERVVLVRPMAVTHQTDTEQRVVGMQFTRSGNTLSVTAPGGVHPHPIAPRGYYLLFVLNGNGVPSQGRFVRLH